MSKPLVSVLIDTYNHERFIKQAIVSVLEQDVSPGEMEVLVVDDGSTDQTPGIVRKFIPRVRYLRKANGGQASAFNAGIPEARGEIVAFLDGDDWWAPRKLPIVLEELAKHPEVGAVGHGLNRVLQDGRADGCVLPDRPYLLHFGNTAAARLFTYLRAFLGTSRLTIRKRLLDAILPIPEELVIEADEYIFTLAPALSQALVLDQALVNYRFHSGSLYMIQSHDLDKLRRKQAVLAALARLLPPRLTVLGVTAEARDVVAEPLRLEAERHTLMLDGGMPWRTFAVERSAYRLSYKDYDLGYLFFKWLVLGLTLLVPPRRFYQGMRWYRANGLRRVRKVLGEPTAAAPVIQIGVETQGGPTWRGGEASSRQQMPRLIGDGLRGLNVRKPDFFIVGAPRCGTTALFTYLRSHPEILMSSRKEPHYFAPDVGYPGRVEGLEDYLKCFAGEKGEKRVGEASTSYLRSNCAAEKIKEFNPTAQIIIMLRDPVETLYSFFSLSVHGVDGLQARFKAGLEQETRPKPNGSSFPPPLRSVVRFAEQVEKYFRVFGRKNVHIIIFDDFKSDAAGVYRETLRFLGVSTDHRPTFQLVNANRNIRSQTFLHLLRYRPPLLRRVARALLPFSTRVGIWGSLLRLNSAQKPRPPMDLELRRQLQKEFEQEVEQLSRLLGRDLTAWCK
jgi:glycosyltransferase involved in cell wall biosynthesis